MARKATVMDQSARLPEPDILKDDVLREGLARRLIGGKYWTSSPVKMQPQLQDDPAALRDALRRWRATPTCPADAAAVARGLVGAFPNTRVDAASFAMGLAAVVEDERGLTPDIVRAVARKMRAEKRSLPPIADLRDAMLAEAKARRRLLDDLEDYEPEWQRKHKRERGEAERLAAAAARVGVPITPDELIQGYDALAIGEYWLHDIDDDCPRSMAYAEDHIILQIKRAGPHAAQAARLLALFGPYEAARQAALARENERLALTPDGIPAANSPQWRAWDAEWPVASERFAEEFASMVAALGLAEESE